MTLPKTNPMEKILAFKLSGSTLVEASAGTGKTWTLAALYLRILLEQKLDPAQILVLTFTEAATRELRERLRKRLKQALVELDDLESEGKTEGGAKDAGLLAGLKSVWTDSKWQPKEIRHRLERAIEQFDEASIFTIHGFCARALQEYPLAAGLPGDVRVAPDSDEAGQAWLFDQFRQMFHPAQEGFLHWLDCQMKSMLDPATWLRLLQSVQGQDGELLLGEAEAVDSSLLQKQLRDECKAAHAEWLYMGGAVAVQARLDPQLVNRNKYKPGPTLDRLARLGHWLERPGTSTPPDKVELFARGTMGMKKNAPEPEGAFFDAMAPVCVTWRKLESAYRETAHSLLNKALRVWPEHMRALRVEQGALGYDDLLHLLLAALRAESGDDLGGLLEDRWRAVLVDEFQDTDPVQAAILSHVFRRADRPLFYVGDPKQAIYSFRGADLNTYLREAEKSQQRYTLSENWRSRPELVKVLNQLFQDESGNRQLFLNPGITSVKVQSALEGKGRRLYLPDGSPSVLQVVRSSSASKPEASRTVARDLAQRILQLLEWGAAGEAGFQMEDGTREDLQGGDIVVLVRKGHQGQLVSRELERRGVPHVLGSGLSVWKAVEADQLEQLLAALAFPERRALLHGLLLCPLFGPAREQINEQVLEREANGLRILLQLCNRNWARFGGARALKELFQEISVEEKAVLQARGERSLANLKHMLELLLEDSAARNPAESLRQMRRMRHRSQGDDSMEQRLESEQNLVRVMTQHKSKGLEFPIVFAPFLWDSGRVRDAELRMQNLHVGTESRLKLVTPFQRLNEEEAEGRAREELAEDMRLCYVTLTRASQKLVVHCAELPGKGRKPCALDWLLRDISNTPEKIAGWKPDASERGTGWKTLSRKLDGAGISITTPLAEGGGRFMVGDRERSLEAVDVSQVFPIVQTRAVSSFSSLFSHGDVDTPDHDQARPLQDVEPNMDDAALAFPRGAAAGSCLHEVLERIDYGMVDNPEVWAPELEQALTQHGLADVDREATLNWIAEICKHRFAGSANPLCEIPSRNRMCEMSFHLAVGKVPGSSLQDLLRKHDFFRACDPNLEAEGLDPLLQNMSDRLKDGIPAGLLKGFIDLVYEDNGRWWVLDWKSNWLANSRSGVTHTLMAAEMARASYFLQALFYSLALHRHLDNRLPNYDPARHLGGYRYIFLRGVRHGVVGSGCYEGRWSPELMKDLDILFGGQLQ